MINPPTLEEFKALDPITLVARYRLALEHLDERVFELDDDQLDTAFLADVGVGKMPCRHLLCHLADAELVFTFRIRRTLAEDRPMLADWDHEAFWDSPLYGNARGESDHDGVQNPIGALAASIHTLRQWTAATLFQIQPEDWYRAAMHPTRGELSVRHIVELNAWHFEHHAAYLNAKVERMLGPRPTRDAAKMEDCQEGARVGGCGPGCGCAQG